MKKVDLKDLFVYQLSIEIGEEVWSLVDNWNHFQKDTIGKQLVRAADSIVANIAEGYGRYHFKENKNFNYYARGSIFESWTWIRKAKARNLIEEDRYRCLNEKFKILSIKHNNYLKSIGEIKEDIKSKSQQSS